MLINKVQFFLKLVQLEFDDIGDTIDAAALAIAARAIQPFPALRILCVTDFTEADAILKLKSNLDNSGYLGIKELVDSLANVSRDLRRGMRMQVRRATCIVASIAQLEQKNYNAMERYVV